MTPAAARVMAAIRASGDDHPTMGDIVATTGFSVSSVRDGIRELRDLGMINPRRSAWAISRLGRTFAASKRGQRVLDVPAGARG